MSVKKSFMALSGLSKDKGTAHYAVYFLASAEGFNIWLSFSLLVNFVILNISLYFQNFHRFLGTLYSHALRNFFPWVITALSQCNLF